MLYQGIIGGGSSPVEPENLSPVLLWTNPSPTSEFAAKTVSVDLTNYEGVIVEYEESTSISEIISRVYCKRNENIRFGCGYTFDSSARSRNLSINDNGVTFSDAYIQTEKNNTYLVPVKIYGVKEYVVEPNYGKHNIEWTATNSPYELETDKPVQMIYFKNKTSAMEYVFAILNDDGTYISYATGYTFTKISDTKIKIGYSESNENFSSGNYQVYYIV